MAFNLERPHFKALPIQRAIDFSLATARVTTSSTIAVKKVMYSVPSRLIGYQLNIHVYDDYLSCYQGANHILDLPRLRVSNKSKTVRCINYRHIISSLSRKPGAFRYSILRDDILPTPTYKNIWKLFDQHCSRDRSSKLMVGITNFLQHQTTHSIIFFEVFGLCSKIYLQTLLPPEITTL